MAFDGADAWVPDGPSLVEIQTSDLTTVRTVTLGTDQLAQAAVASPGAANVYVTSIVGGSPGPNDGDVYAWAVGRGDRDPGRAG